MFLNNFNTHVAVQVLSALFFNHAVTKTERENNSEIFQLISLCNFGNPLIWRYVKETSGKTAS